MRLTEPMQFQRRLGDNTWRREPADLDYREFLWRSGVRLPASRQLVRQIR